MILKWWYIFKADIHDKTWTETNTLCFSCRMSYVFPCEDSWPIKSTVTDRNTIWPLSALFVHKKSSVSTASFQGRKKQRMGGELLLMQFETLIGISDTCRLSLSSTWRICLVSLLSFKPDLLIIACLLKRWTLSCCGQLQTVQCSWIVQQVKITSCYAENV